MCRHQVAYTRHDMRPDAVEGRRVVFLETRCLFSHFAASQLLLQRRQTWMNRDADLGLEIVILSSMQLALGVQVVQDSILELLPVTENDDIDIETLVFSLAELEEKAGGLSSQSLRMLATRR